MPISRAERARRIAGWVSDQVRDVAPEGVGRWGPAWEIVAEPSDRFLAALEAWEDAGDNHPHEAELRCSVQETAGAVVDAWREAAGEWRSRTRQTPQEAQAT